MAMRRSDSVTRRPRAESGETENKTKVVLIGEMGVGKTDLLMTGIHSLEANGGVPFQHMTGPTVAFDFFPSTRKLLGGKTLTILFIDTAGQERFQTLVHSNYRDVTAFALVYDVTDAASFLALQRRWQPEAAAYYEDSAQRPLWFLIGSKTDLHTQREVTYEEAQKYATSIDAFFYETNTHEGKGARARVTLDLIAATLNRNGIPADVERSPVLVKLDTVLLGNGHKTSKRGKCAC